MDLSLERDGTALGSLFQQIIADMKNTSPLWDDFVAKASKLHACLRAAIQAIAAYLDAFQKIADAATNSRGASKEIGTALTRVCLRHKAVETRMKSFTAAIMDSLVNPLQEKLEDWKRHIAIIDKDHAKEYKRCRAELKKRSNDTLRLQKKARKGQSDTIQSLVDSHMQDVTFKRAELEDVERKSLRSVMVEERKRYCTFVHMLQPVVKEECEVMFELGHLQEAMQSIAIVTKEPDILPQSSEELILESKSSINLYPESPGGNSGSQGGCSNSLGSRKSSVCSISSMNSSGSSSSPGHHYQRSLSQLISPVIRLKPGESSDSGFCSSPALTSQASTTVSQSHAVSTWPPHSQDVVPTNDRPHTISSAYEKGHQRPALTVYTFQNPETIMESQKSPANISCRPPLPIRCSSLERPLSATGPRNSNPNLIQRQCPSPIPAHITKELPQHQPTYVNMSELASMAAMKITNQQLQQQHQQIMQQHQQQQQGDNQKLLNNSNPIPTQHNPQQPPPKPVRHSTSSIDSKTQQISTTTSGNIINDQSQNSVGGEITSEIINNEIIELQNSNNSSSPPSSGNNIINDNNTKSLSNSPQLTPQSSIIITSSNTNPITNLITTTTTTTPIISPTNNINDSNDSSIGKLSKDLNSKCLIDGGNQDELKITENIITTVDNNNSNSSNSNGNINNSNNKIIETTNSTVAGPSAISIITDKINDITRGSVLEKMSIFEQASKQAAATVTNNTTTTTNNVSQLSGGRSSHSISSGDSIYSNRKEEIYKTNNGSGNVSDKDPDQIYEDSIQELNNLIGELDSFQREHEIREKSRKQNGCYIENPFNQFQPLITTNDGSCNIDDRSTSSTINDNIIITNGGSGGIDTDNSSDKISIGSLNYSTQSTGNVSGSNDMKFAYSDSEISRYVSENSSIIGGFENPTFIHFNNNSSSSNSTTAIDKIINNNDDDNNDRHIMIFDHSLQITPDIDYATKNSEIVVLRCKENNQLITTDNQLQNELPKQRLSSFRAEQQQQPCQEKSYNGNNSITASIGLESPGLLNGTIKYGINNKNIQQNHLPPIVTITDSSSSSGTSQTTMQQKRNASDSSEKSFDNHVVIIENIKQIIPPSSTTMICINKEFKANLDEKLRQINATMTKSSSSKPMILPRPASLSGCVTRLARRSSVNSAKPPPPVRRSSSVTTSHALSTPNSPNMIQQNLQNTSSAECLPPPPAYLLDRQQNNSSPSTVKVSETVKALAAIRHTPASPSSLRRTQQINQQLNQQAATIQSNKQVNNQTPNNIYSPCPTITTMNDSSSLGSIYNNTNSSSIQHQQLLSQQQQQQQLSSPKIPLSINTSSDSSNYNNNSFRTNNSHSPSIYAQPKQITKMSSFRAPSSTTNLSSSSAISPANVSVAGSIVTTLPGQQKPNPSLIAQLNARLTPSNKQQQHSPQHLTEYGNDLYVQQDNKNQSNYSTLQQHHSYGSDPNSPVRHRGYNNFSQHQQQQQQQQDSLYSRGNERAYNYQENQQNYDGKQNQLYGSSNNHYQQYHTKNNHNSLSSSSTLLSSHNLASFSQNQYHSQAHTNQTQKQVNQQQQQQQMKCQQQNHYNNQKIISSASAPIPTVRSSSYNNQQHQQVRQHQQQQQNQSQLHQNSQQQQIYDYHTTNPHHHHHHSNPISSSSSINSSMSLGRHNNIQQKILVSTNPFITTTTVNYSPSSSSYGNNYAGANTNFSPSTNDGTIKNISGSIRSKSKSEFLENLNAKLAKQGLSGKAFAVRNLINSKTLHYENLSSRLQRPSIQYQTREPDPRICHESLMDQIKRGAPLKRNKKINDRSAPKIH